MTNMNEKTVFKKIILLILMFSVTTFIWAQELTVEEAQAKALEKSQSVEIANINLQKAVNNAEVKNYLPTFSLSGSITESADLQKNTLDSLKKPSITITPAITWTLSSLDLLTKSTNNLGIQQATLSLEKAVASVKGNVTTSYYKLVSLLKAVTQAETSVNNAKYSYDRTLELYNNSKASQLSLLQSQMSYQDSLLALDSAISSFETALDSFRTLTGIDYDFSLSDIPQIDEIDVDKLYEIADEYFYQTTAIRSAQLSIQSAEISTHNAEITNKYPSVGLSSNLNYSSQKNSKNNNFDSSWTVSASLRVNVPVDVYLPWTKTHASMQNSYLDIDNAKLSLDSAEESLKSNLKQSISGIENYISKTENLNSHLELARENYNLVLEAYEEGYCPYNDLNTARVSLESAQVALTNNKMNIINQLCSFATLLELDLNSVVEYLK